MNDICNSFSKATLKTLGKWIKRTLNPYKGQACIMNAWYIGNSARGDGANISTPLLQYTWSNAD